MSNLSEAVAAFLAVNLTPNPDSALRETVKRAYLAGVASSCIILRESQQPEITLHNLLIDVKLMMREKA